MPDVERDERRVECEKPDTEREPPDPPVGVAEGAGRPEGKRHPGFVTHDDGITGAEELHNAERDQDSRS